MGLDACTMCFCEVYMGNPGLEKRPSGVAEPGHTMLYEASQIVVLLTMWRTGAASVKTNGRCRFDGG